jgi:hypothetical protein
LRAAEQQALVDPRGVSGMITMKMMINTDRTSIQGVMLISAFFRPPALIVVAMEGSSAH